MWKLSHTQLYKGALLGNIIEIVVWRDRNVDNLYG